MVYVTDERMHFYKQTSPAGTSGDSVLVFALHYHLHQSTQKILLPFSLKTFLKRFTHIFLLVLHRRSRNRKNRKNWPQRNNYFYRILLDELFGTMWLNFSADRRKKTARGCHSRGFSWLIDALIIKTSFCEKNKTKSNHRWNAFNHHYYIYECSHHWHFLKFSISIRFFESIGCFPKLSKRTQIHDIQDLWFLLSYFQKFVFDTTA